MVLKTIKEKMCDLFGHKPDLIEETILKIKMDAVNKEDFRNDTIKCLRCGVNLRLKNN